MKKDTFASKLTKLFGRSCPFHNKIKMRKQNKIQQEMENILSQRYRPRFDWDSFLMTLCYLAPYFVMVLALVLFFVLGWRGLECSTSSCFYQSMIIPFYIVLFLLCSVLIIGIVWIVISSWFNQGVCK